MSPYAELARSQLFLHGHLARPDDLGDTVPPPMRRTPPRAWRRLALALLAVLHGR